MNVSEEDKRAIYQEIIDATRKSSLRDKFPMPNITVREFSELEGVTHDVAYKRLENAVRSGSLKKQAGVLINGHACCIYWKPTP